MRQRGVLGALAAAVFLGVAAAAVVLPATVAAASVSPPAAASTVSVNLVGEARVGALLTATLDFAHWSAPTDATSVEFEWLLEKAVSVTPPTPTPPPAPSETAAPTSPAPAHTSIPAAVPLLSCAPSNPMTSDAAALPPAGLAIPAPAALPTPAPLPQEASLAALPVLPLVTATQLQPEQAHASTEPAATPAPTSSPPTTVARGPEYTVLPADLGHTVRVRAAVSVGGQLVATCESAPTAPVVAADAPRPDDAAEPLTPLQPATPAEVVTLPAEATPQWQPRYSELGEGAAGDNDEVLAQPAPAASGPVVAISLSSEVMLIGGAAVLVVVAGLAIFGRNES